MSKVYIAYTLAALCLFGALFATFAMSGLGMTGPLEVTRGDAAAEGASDAGTPPAKPDAVPAIRQVDYPDLAPGQTYRVSHRTPIYAEPSVQTARRQELPAGGYFLIQSSDEHNGALWYRVTVNDGVRDYTMYLLAKDLDFKKVTARRDATEQDADRRERALRELRAWAAKQRRPPLEVGTEASAEDEQPEPRSFNDWWRDVVQRLGGATTANLVVAGLAAFVLTVFTVGAIVLAVLLRRTHAWERPVVDEEGEDVRPAAADRGSEFYEHDAPAAGGEEDPF